MVYGTTTRRRLPLYLIAILIGMGGVLFSRQIESLAFRFAIVTFSVAVPLFASGNMLARPSLGRLQRTFLLLGVILLLGGAGFSLSGLSDSLIQEEMLPPGVAAASQLIGILSLFVGLFVVLYSVVRTGEDIEELADRFWHLAEQMNEGLLLSSPEGRIVLANKRILDLFGMKEEDIIGQSTTVLAQEFNMGPVLAHFDRRAEGIASEYQLSSVIRGEERRLSISGNPVFDRHGRHTGTLGLVRDITEQYRLSQRIERYNRGLKQLIEEQTERLRQSEEQFRQLLVSMNEGFLTLSASYRVRFANARICEMLRIGQDSLPGRDIFDFLDTTGRVHLLNLLAQASSLDSAELRREVSFLNTEGALVAAVVAVTFMHDAEPEEAQYSLVVTNVAELKRMQFQLELRARELEKANEELRLHDRAKDSFLSNVSHELRTPLSTIQGYLDMFESGGLGKLDVTQEGALRVMRRNVDRLIAQINEIIEFSRMEIRGVQLTVSLFSPAKLIRDCVASVHPQALAKDISLNVFAEEDIGPMWADREKMAQVLGILLNNAVKFSDPGGMIQVRLERRGMHGVAFTVSDTGIGISSVYHQRVFMKFFQVDASRSRRYGGTGIGLSIAKSIVDAHKGAIELRSARGEGSTFTVVLPNALFDRTYEPDSNAGLERIRILVIAGSHAFRDTIGALLQGLGCSVRSIQNGFEGARIAAEMRPNVIVLMDSARPESGDATLAALRNQPNTMDIPIIVCSDADAERLREASESNPDVYFLATPFSARNLLGYLRHALFDDPLPMAARVHTGAHEERATPRVLIVDPDPSLLEWAEIALHQRGVPCCCALDLQQGLDLMEHEPPDIIFMDVDAPEAVVHENAAALRAADGGRDLPIYGMSGLTRAAPAGNGLAGVLKKPFTAGELLGIVENSVRRVGAPRD